MLQREDTHDDLTDMHDIKFPAHFYYTNNLEMTLNEIMTHDLCDPSRRCQSTTEGVVVAVKLDG